MASAPLSFRLAGSSQPPSSHLTNGKKRPRSSLHEADNDDDEVEAQPQLVSGFDHAAGGAVTLEGQQEQNGPLVIKSLRNKDWREESRRRRPGRSIPNGRAGEDKKDVDSTNTTTPSYGLSFAQQDLLSTGDAKVNGKDTPEKEKEEKEKTVDELAIEALANGTSGRKSNLVLPLVDDPTDNISASRFDTRASMGVSEDDAFRADVSSRPESASLADYAAVPVEEFGAALLRGMGWKEGDVVGKRKDVVSKLRVVERRPALLGIGAKEMPNGVGEELGAWGKAAIKGKQRKIDTVYNPVLLKHSKTGEMLTEEELKKRVEEDKKAKDEEDWRQRRDRNLQRDSKRKDRRRDGGGSRPRSRYYQIYPLL